MKKYARILLFTIIPVLFLLTLTASAEETYEFTAQKIANDIYKTWTVTFNEELDRETVNNSTVFVENPFNRKVAVTVALSADGKNVSVTPSQMYVPELEYELVVQGVVSTSNEVLSPSVKIPFVIEVLEEEKKAWVDRKTVSDSSSEQPTSTPEKSTDTNTNTDVSNPFGGGSSSNTNNQQSSTTSPAKQSTEKKPEHLTTIKVDVNSLVSNVTVKTSNFVATVKINGKRMHYQGKNVYELSVPALKTGQTIKVEAYATYEDNSLLEQINHKVK